MEKLLFFTDLDATMLDSNYSYEQAKPAICALKKKGYPLILNSSKTLAEIIDLSAQLKSTDPIISENGGTIGIPLESKLPRPPECTNFGNYAVHQVGIDRESILEFAHQLRNKHQYKFAGFADWSSETIAKITGLKIAAAERARMRLATEPILWQDSEKNFEQFKSFLKNKQIHCVRGGKFIHLMSHFNKATGASIIRELYRKKEPNTHWTTVALGDSENDLHMLEQADIAVVIPNSGEVRIRPNHNHLLIANLESSAGWAESVFKILNTFQK